MSKRLDIDLQQAINQVEQSVRTVDLARQQQGVQLENTPPPTLLLRALKQFFGVLGVIESDSANPYAVSNSSLSNVDDDPMDIQDISTLCSYGFRLLEDLIHWCTALDLDSQRRELYSVVVTVALWTSRFEGEIHSPELAVNALADLANGLHEPESLKQLSAIMDKIELALPQTIRHDHDRSNPARPWRVLMLNHGIVATRTHEPHIMEPVFERIVTDLPEDAADFFAEGVRQLDIVGYPQPVRSVIQLFYRRTHPESLH